MRSSLSALVIRPSHRVIDMRNVIGYKVLRTVRVKGQTMEFVVNEKQHLSSSARVGVMALVILLFGVGACTNSPEPAAGPEDEALSEGIAKLTAVAGAEAEVVSTPMASEGENNGDGSNAPVGHSDDGAASMGGTIPTADPLAGLEGELPDEVRDLIREVGEADSVLGGQFDEETGLPQEEAAAQFDVARATQEAKAGIADVSQLVLAREPLATFTPSMRDDLLDGNLLYVRSGAFYTANADASDIKKLPLEDSSMPGLWAPPEDPGKAWRSPDGETVAFFAGSDAGLWMMDVDGQNNRAVLANTLPSEQHTATVGGASQTVKLRPGKDYTLVYGPNGDSIFGVLIDDNGYHVRGEGRVRVVHAARGLAGQMFSAQINGYQEGSPVRFGRANSLSAQVAGNARLDLKDANGEPVMEPAQLTVGDGQLLTWFVYGEKEIGVVAIDYPSGSQATSGQSRVRVFNTSSSQIDVEIDGSTSPIRAVEPGTISGYVGVQGVLSQDALGDAELSIYGLRTGEEPIAWAPNSKRLAFVSAADGVVDLHMWDSSGDRITRLTESSQREVNPSWSPGSSSLAWTSVDEGYGQNALYVMTDGELQLVDLAPIASAAGLDSGRSMALPYAAGWLDDDTMFFYPYADAAAQGIWTYDTRNGDLSPIVTGALDLPRFSVAASAWLYNRIDDGGRLYRLDVDGTETTLVEAEAYGGDWSPDGKVVTYGEGISTRIDGWSLASIGADGGSSEVLTGRIPMVQISPPVPGPDAKRFWIDDNTVVFSQVGRDYGRRDREGVTGRTEAGDDIENLYSVSADGKSAPKQLTDMVKTFYINDLEASRSGDELGFIAFSYRNRAQQLYTVASEGGKPTRIDGAVRWFTWVD